jgi:urease accessory protein
MKNQTFNPWRNLRLTSLVAMFALAPVLARAHPLHGQTVGLAGGLSHPLLGLDHLLAMVAVGLWAAQLGGRALWLVPAAFVSLMGLGGALGIAGAPVPLVETGVLLSVLVLGVLVTAAVRLPMAAGVALVGFFALFHGHAHGTEIPPAAAAFAYGLGFVLTTASLHACGIGLGLLAQRNSSASAVRFAGAAIILAGLGLWLF